jgi:transposase-like protein
MDIKTQIIQEYLTQGGGFRKLAEKYGISRTNICKWVLIHQGIHNLPPTQKQEKHSVYSMSNSKKKHSAEQLQSTEALHQKIAVLEKQLEWEKLRAEALDTMINIALQ